MYGKIIPERKSMKVNVYHSNNPREKSIYENALTKDPNTITQILIDLFVLGFPIEKAIKKFKERIKNKRDWMGI